MNQFELAVTIVGYTEILKNLFNVDKKFLKFLMAVLSGAGVISLYVLFGDNERFMLGLRAFAYATLAYDTIVKRLKNGSTSHSCSTVDSSDDDIDKIIDEFQDSES